MCELVHPSAEGFDVSKVLERSQPVHCRRITRVEWQAANEVLTAALDSASSTGVMPSLFFEVVYDCWWMLWRLARLHASTASLGKHFMRSCNRVIRGLSLAYFEHKATGDGVFADPWQLLKQVFRQTRACLGGHAHGVRDPDLPGHGCSVHASPSARRRPSPLLDGSKRHARRRSRRDVCASGGRPSFRDNSGTDRSMRQKRLSRRAVVSEHLDWNPSIHRCWTCCLLARSDCLQCQNEALPALRELNLNKVGAPWSH